MQVGRPVVVVRVEGPTGEGVVAGGMNGELCNPDAGGSLGWGPDGGRCECGAGA